MKRVVVAIAAAGVALACGGSGDQVASGSDSNVNAREGAPETCTASFHWLQKDAYKNTGGRTTALWPPHTTTTLDVRCTSADGKETFTASAFKENHGTKPGTLDPNGKPFLVDVKHVEAKGTRDQLTKLLDAYKRCDCEAATEFLSMDMVKEDLTMKKILEAFADYAGQHLSCSGDATTNDVVTLLKNAEYERVLAALPSCTWEKDYGFLEGLTSAAQGVLPDLSKFHVCNNDAKLEAALFARFAADGTTPACDAATDTCKGPAFFYSP
jgi:hypothetical protein